MRRLCLPLRSRVALFLLWILLMQSFERRDACCWAPALALFWPAVTARLDGQRPCACAGRCAWHACSAGWCVDMLRSNAEVAWAILTRRSRGIRSGFVLIPLELRDPNGLAVLAMIVTFTPGTAWAQLSADNRVLLLHVLAIADETDLVAFIKHRYERPLREIFE